MMLCGFVTLNRENPFPAGPEPVKLCTLAGYWGGSYLVLSHQQNPGCGEGFFCGPEAARVPGVLGQLSQGCTGVGLLGDYWGVCAGLGAGLDPWGFFPT